jgi:hypothetical protein
MASGGVEFAAFASAAARIEPIRLLGVRRIRLGCVSQAAMAPGEWRRLSADGRF